MGDIEDAMRHLQKSYEFSKDLAEPPRGAYMNRALWGLGVYEKDLYKSFEYLKEAIEVGERALDPKGTVKPKVAECARLCAQNSRQMISEGLCATDLGWDTARFYALKARDADASNGDAWAEVGFVRFYDEDYKGGVEAFERAQSLGTETEFSRVLIICRAMADRQ